MFISFFLLGLPNIHLTTKNRKMVIVSWQAQSPDWLLDSSFGKQNKKKKKKEETMNKTAFMIIFPILTTKIIGL